MINIKRDPLYIVPLSRLKSTRDQTNNLLLWRVWLLDLPAKHLGQGWNKYQSLKSISLQTVYGDKVEDTYE